MKPTKKWSCEHTASSLMYMLQCYSLIIPSSPSPNVFTSLFSMSAFPLLPCKQIHQCHLSRFYFSLYDQLHTVQQALGSSILLELAQMRSFLQLSSISLCICTTVSFSIHLLMLSSFCFLAIINSAVMNIDVHVSFPIMISSGCMSSCGILRTYAQQWGCWVIWCFYSQFFKASPYCSPQ